MLYESAPGSLKLAYPIGLACLGPSVAVPRTSQTLQNCEITIDRNIFYYHVL